MIVNDFHIVRLTLIPLKADSPLIVDANTVLTAPCAMQGFEAVSGGNAEVVQPACDLQLAELSPGDGFDVDEATDADAIGERLGIGALERNDHAPIITPYVINVKRDGRPGRFGLFWRWRRGWGRR